MKKEDVMDIDSTVKAMDFDEEFENEDSNEVQDLNYNSSEETEDKVKENHKMVTEEQENISPDITDDDDIIMVSMYLPFNPYKKEDGTYDFVLTDEPLYHTLYKIIEKKNNVKWFGSLKNEKNIKDSERKEIAIQLKQKKLYVFDLDKEIYKKVLVLIEEILEPLFHYAPVKSSIMEDFNIINEHWKAYKEYNEFVCKVISQHLTPKSLIYLHDIHYFLVPNILYAMNKYKNSIMHNLSIGIFIHSPFPSYDVFKKIPFREDIIRSLIKCRVIGFHTFDYSRNFLKSSKRLLSINYVSTSKGDLATNYLDHTALIKVNLVTPDIDLLREAIKGEEFQKYYKEITQKHSKKKNIFVSVDHMKFLLSIKNKLDGYQKFLSDLGDRAGKNVFLLYIRYSDNEKDKDNNFVLEKNQKKMIEIIDKLVLEIKKKFGDDVIELYKGKVTYIHRLALFASSNCFVRTSKQESYSLGLYEFLILKNILNKGQNVAYMISELSGANTSLGSTIKINPFDWNSMRNGFLVASRKLSEDNKQEPLSLEKDYNHAMKSSFKGWFYSFLKEVKNTKLSDENTLYMGVDEGLNFKLMKINSDFMELNMKKIAQEYEKSVRRLLFFDYEGTLPSTYSNQNDEFVSKGSHPTSEILIKLSELTADKRNKVFIVAGKGKDRVKEWFSEVKNLGLAAEHGFLYSINGQDGDKWKRTIKNYKTEWIESCCEIIYPFLERCEGSFLDKKQSSVVWQYTDCDQELGKSFANVMATELDNIKKKYNLKLINGKGFVEIISKGINKGYFVSYIVKEAIIKGRIPDFILCVGDDTSDEKMFHYLNIRKNQIKNYSKNVRLYSVTVGKKPSNAQYYVESTKNVQDLIDEFAKSSSKMTNSISTFDIRRNFDSRFED